MVRKEFNRTPGFGCLVETLDRTGRSTLFILAVVAALALVTLAASADHGAAGPGPMDGGPSGPGPLQVGFFDTTFRGSTKAYDVPLRVFYPAMNRGPEAPPDLSQAPYMAVVWFPFYGGTAQALDLQCEHLASWGAVAVAFGVNWEDRENSGDPDDINDLLDLLEDWNATEGHRLHRMVDKGAYGTCGFSSGGGISLITGAQVTRVRAIQSFGAAIYNAAVDGIAPLFNGRPLLLQVGQEDAAYIAGSRRAYQKVGAPCILAESINSGHMGPFQDGMYVAFYLYHLRGAGEYWKFLYGDMAVDVSVQGFADVFFKFNETHFFPPELTTSVTPQTVAMDVPVSLGATIHGYQRGNETALVHGWDVDGDGGIDLRPQDGPNTTYAFTSPGQHDVRYHYILGMLDVVGRLHVVEVTNVRPVAVAGPDVEVDHDGSVTVDGNASWDSPSDLGRLMYRWEFTDGFSTTFTGASNVTRPFPLVGVVTATLTVLDPHGGYATDVLNVTVVNLPPTASAGGPLEGDEDEPLTLAGGGGDTPSHAGYLVYRWDFGDSILSDWSAGPGASHAYARSGTYEAVLTVKDPEGATGTASATVQVRNLDPTATIISPDDGDRFEKGEPVGFSATGNDTRSDLVGLEFMWDFGDGTVTGWLGRRDTDVLHTYPRGGAFLVTLTVRDGDGAVATAVVMLEVRNAPPEAIVVRPDPSVTVDEDTEVTFTGSGSDTPGDQEGLTYEWRVDGTAYPGREHVHIFTESGSYTAELVVTDPEGSEGRKTVSITVVNVAPEVTLQVRPLSVLTGENVSFTTSVLDTPSDLASLRITVEVSDGSSYDLADGTHSFSSAGTYLFKVTVVDDDGGTATATASVTVTEPPGPPGPVDGEGADGGEGSGTFPLAAAGIITAVAAGAVVALLLSRRGRSEGRDDDEDRP